MLTYNIIFPLAGANSVYTIVDLSREQCASVLYNTLRGIILFFTEIRATLENDKTWVPAAAHTVSFEEKKNSEQELCEMRLPYE